MRNGIKSHVLSGAELEPIDKLTQIAVPETVAENSGLTGFALSERLRQIAGVEKIELKRAVIEGKEPFEYADLARAIAADGDVQPVHGYNWIRLRISSQSVYAGSDASYIWMYFGRNHKITLHGLPSEGFPRGRSLTWNLNKAKAYLESVPVDAWDEITLSNPSNDGILIENVEIVHSSERILDWDCSHWLDHSKLQEHGHLGLTAKILETKLERIENHWEPQLHWAARELGKTDYTKYGTGTVWCSEFASWCLRKALWDTPEGSIDFTHLENYFKTEDRLFTKQQLLDDEYRLSPGDYVHFPGHSALFVKYLDEDTTNPDTELLSIDGNVGFTVGIRRRKLSEVVSVGCTR